MCTLAGFVLTKAEKANLDNWLKACKDKKSRTDIYCGKVTESNLCRKDFAENPK